MHTIQQNSLQWFKELRDLICQEFITLERELVHNENNFHCKKWSRPGGGGGEMRVMYGQIFEKVGVNVSEVYGEFTNDLAHTIPNTYKHNKKFWASGISLVAHMHSPLIPPIHMNTRFICTRKQWFGGGIDLSPIYYNHADAVFFHNKLKQVCDLYDQNYYNQFKKWADEYFYLSHRDEARGIGGIFYDELSSGDLDKDFAFTRAVGNAFLEIYPAIIRNNIHYTYTPEQREYQLYKRGRYVEFNLLHDRGTKFGLKTDGFIDAIMMSMPPLVKWH